MLTPGINELKELKDFDNPWGKKTPKGVTRQMSAILNSGVFPGMQGGPLEHVIAAKAVAFNEALSDEFERYTVQVMKNAQAMSGEFLKRGYDITSGGTDNHLMLIDLRNKDISGKKAERLLGEADITVNKNMVPFDTRSPFITSGMRVGTAAATTRGMVEADMIKIVEWMDTILMNAEDDGLRETIKGEVNLFADKFPMFDVM